MSPSDLLTLLRNHIRATFVSPSAGYRLVSMSVEDKRQESTVATEIFAGL
jgi:hypothetical protein